MFKLDRKLIISASAVAAAALLAAGCAESVSSMMPGASTNKAGAVTSRTYDNGKKVIDGGVAYPVTDSKAGPYHVNQDTQEGGYAFGRTPTSNELAAWATSVTPWAPPPEGSGSVEEGGETYESKCVMCHGDFGSGGGGYPSLANEGAEEGKKSLTNQRTGPDMDGPIRVFGSYWPQASTLWWYIKEGMPHPNTRSLSEDEVYGLVAYILNINEMSIDGEEVDDEYVLDQEKFMKIKMLNEDGFEPVIDGPAGTDNVRAYYDDPKNFGGIKERCMTDCQKPTAKVVHITVESKDFEPPLVTVKDLPSADINANVDSAQTRVYESSCAMCHADSSMGAPVRGNKTDWEKVSAKGMDTVYKNAIEGINGMPPKGGTSMTDNQMRTMVDWLLEESKIDKKVLK